MKRNKIVPIISIILMVISMTAITLVGVLGWRYEGVLFIIATINAIGIWYQSKKLKIWGSS